MRRNTVSKVYVRSGVPSQVCRCCCRKVEVGLERRWLSKSVYSIPYCHSLLVIYTGRADEGIRPQGVLGPTAEETHVHDNLCPVSNLSHSNQKGFPLNCGAYLGHPGSASHQSITFWCWWLFPWSQCSRCTFVLVVHMLCFTVFKLHIF